MDEGKTRWGRKKTRWGTREDRMADNVRQNSEKERHREDWEMKNRTGSGSATQFFYNLDASKLTGFAKRVIMFNFLSRFIRLAMSLNWTAETHNSIQSSVEILTRI